MTVMTPPDRDVRQALPPPRVRRYRNLPDPRPRSRISSAIIYIVVAVLVTAVGLLYLIQTNHVAGLGYEMSQLQRERAALMTRNEELNFALASYESIAEIESVAIGQLGMQESEEYVFVTVPRPANDQLVLPDPVPEGKPTLVQRIWNGLTGAATTVSENPEVGR